MREAHSINGWQVARNEKEGILLESAKNYEQKDSHATSCARDLGIEFTTLVDGMNNAVELAYSAWPDRYYFAADDGRVASKGEPGPAGFKAPGIESAIVKLLGAAIPRRDRQGAFFAAIPSRDRQGAFFAAIPSRDRQGAFFAGRVRER